MRLLTISFLIAVSTLSWSGSLVHHPSYVTSEGTVLLACSSRDLDGEPRGWSALWVAIQRSGHPGGGVLNKGNYRWSKKLELEITPISYALLRPFGNRFYIDRRNLSAIEGRDGYQCEITSLEQIEYEVKESIGERKI